MKCSRCRYVLVAWGGWLVLVLGLCPVSQAWGQNHKSGLPPDLQALIAESLKANAEVKQMASLAGATKETIGGLLKACEDAGISPEYMPPDAVGHLGLVACLVIGIHAAEKRHG